MYSFSAERAVSPLDGSELWVVLDPELVPHREASDFLRFCARTGVIGQAVAGQLSEPRWLRFTPPGFDAGESGQFRAVRARALKARTQAPFPEALTDEQAEAVLGCCRRPREHFMVILLL